MVILTMYKMLQLTHLVYHLIQTQRQQQMLTTISRMFAILLHLKPDNWNRFLFEVDSTSSLLTSAPIVVVQTSSLLTHNIIVLLVTNTIQQTNSKVGIHPKERAKPR